MSRIFHYCPSIVQRDAVGYSTTALHFELLSRGYFSQLVCDINGLQGAPRFTITVQDLIDLRPQIDDLMIFHYSFLDGNADQLLSLPCKKILVYHNITPGHFFRQYGQDFLADCCDRARAYLPTLVSKVDYAIGDSEYNAHELRAAGRSDAVSLPVFFDDAYYRNLSSDHEKFLKRCIKPAIKLVFIGRIVPNKRIDNVIRVAAALKNYFDVPVQMSLFGKVWDAGYYAGLKELISSLNCDREITFEVNQPQSSLRAALAAADGFVSASEHEGFMVPILEAFAVGCPVIALKSSAVTETCGPAALMTDDFDPELIASMVLMLNRDREMKSFILRRQSERVEHFSTYRTMSKWFSVLNNFINLKAA